ncbi:MAG TPA: hypothetical protein VKN36_18310, partial [Eudoraea sp.]|nr:hypothetical protein [Eudoraea sp.]
NRKSYYIERSAAIIAAVILIQTLYFKFSAHPDSVYIFSRIGGEPYLRIGSGIVELIISVLLLYRKTSLLGALLGIGVMAGAIGQHLFVLGIVVNEDGGALFSLALITLVCCSVILFIKRKALLPYISKK